MPPSVVSVTDEVAGIVLILVAVVPVVVEAPEAVVAVSLNIVSVTDEVAEIVLVPVTVAPVLVEVPETVVAVSLNVVSVTDEVAEVVLAPVAVAPVLAEVPETVVAVSLNVVSVTDKVAEVVLAPVTVVPVMVEVPETVVAVSLNIVSVTGEVAGALVVTSWRRSAMLNMCAVVGRMLLKCAKMLIVRTVRVLVVIAGRVLRYCERRIAGVGECGVVPQSLAVLSSILGDSSPKLVSVSWDAISASGSASGSCGTPRRNASSSESVCVASVYSASCSGVGVRLVA